MTRVSPALRRRLDDAEFEATRLWVQRFTKAFNDEVIAAGKPTALAVLERLRDARDRAAPCTGTVREGAVFALRAVAEVSPDIAGRVAAQFDINL
jgi:hypothetical protein